MILFYEKETGKIFGTIDGRVHQEEQLKMYSDSGVGKENIGKYIIGWIEKDGQKMEYNMDKFDLLKKFEDVSDESPLDYEIDIEKNELVKKEKSGII